MYSYFYVNGVKATRSDHMDNGISLSKLLLVKRWQNSSLCTLILCRNVEHGEISNTKALIYFAFKKIKTNHIYHTCFSSSLTLASASWVRSSSFLSCKLRLKRLGQQLLAENNLYIWFENLPFQPYSHSLLVGHQAEWNWYRIINYFVNVKLKTLDE